ncbi:hypothetical protein [Flagellimonas meridianipacifica]|uniref:Uncharacterized protein n=1 Tax=Flagellimonas meridianipacifica TaxID=1080225 RepID=A0A2T0MBI5_9FLAO|nr:hypothetical protein [Allomuricauda pacifica]PRX54864.1 hypothetical protein CLV81_3268 [Allomuricauda pacifica]
MKKKKHMNMGGLFSVGGIGSGESPMEIETLMSLSSKNKEKAFEELSVIKKAK